MYSVLDLITYPGDNTVEVGIPFATSGIIAN